MKKNTKKKGKIPMKLTFKGKPLDSVITLNKTTGKREKVSYQEWCRRVVESINNGETENFRNAEIKEELNKNLQPVCYVEAF